VTRPRIPSDGDVQRRKAWSRCLRVGQGICNVDRALWRREGIAQAIITLGLMNPADACRRADATASLRCRAERSMKKSLKLKSACAAAIRHSSGEFKPSFQFGGGEVFAPPCGVLAEAV